MKKILTTLTVIAATALGAQGQVTNTNYISGTGTTSLSGLTFDPAIATPDDPLNRARLIFITSGFDYAGGIGSIELSGITLSGQGIETSHTFSNVVFNSNRTRGTESLILSPAVKPWLPGENALDFTVEFKNGASAQVFGATLTYRLEYSFFDPEFPEVVLRSGNLSIVAVPEPSTYAAAAGLLALFLWSSRRHLFKLAGARSSASGSDENGAA